MWDESTFLLHVLPSLPECIFYSNASVLYYKFFSIILFIVIVCPALPDITYSQVEVTGIRQGDKANYFCNYGFYLSGNKQRVCQIDGSWSGAEPSCVRKSDALSILMYVHMVYVLLSYRHT